MLRDYTRTFPPRIFILYKPDACQNRPGPLNLTGARYASPLREGFINIPEKNIKLGLKLGFHIVLGKPYYNSCRILFTLEYRKAIFLLNEGSSMGVIRRATTILIFLSDQNYMNTYCRI
jgi:hypothetical protein